MISKMRSPLSKLVASKPLMIQKSQKKTEFLFRTNNKNRYSSSGSRSVRYLSWTTFLAHNQEGRSCRLLSLIHKMRLKKFLPSQTLPSKIQQRSLKYYQTQISNSQCKNQNHKCKLILNLWLLYKKKKRRNQIKSNKS